MKTIIKVMKERMSPAALVQAGQILKDGGLVAFPTETVYGLGANALDEEAAARIYAAKGRPSDNPLIVHIAEWSALDYIVEEISPQAKKLAEAFWPGPLTIIFRKSEKIPAGITGGLETVAVRMPDHIIARAVIQSGGGYIAAPSANTSGSPSPTTAEHVLHDLDGKIDMVIDGGPVGIGLESTIIDMSEAVPMILRPGYISQEMLEQVIGTVAVDQGLLADDSEEKPKAPGMKYRHYAPKADLVIVEGNQTAVVNKINELMQEQEGIAGRIGVIATAETAKRYKSGIVKPIGSIYDEITIARHLYGILREFDKLEVSRIYSEAFETPQMGQAIMNRLIKAANHQILKV